MPAQLVTVFGGTGFLGRRIVRHLYDAGFAVRIASRHPDRAAMIFPDAGPHLRSVHGDINEDKSVIAAIGGAFAVVNVVSLYVERAETRSSRCTSMRPHASPAGLCRGRRRGERTRIADTDPVSNLRASGPRGFIPIERC